MVVGYSAQVIEVMIASPADVVTERDIVRRVISEWNAAHSRSLGIVLLPVGWDTNSVPQMGDRPQAIINGQVLRGADLLIAIFWARLGSPTGSAESGTVEEIEEHLNARKSAMIYFSSAPVPSNVDVEQLSALRAFKKSLKDRGLYEEYADHGDFRTKLTRQLAQKLIEKHSPGDTVGSIAAGGLLPLPAPPRLTKFAKTLVVEASKDKQGMILCTAAIDGATVQTNETVFTRDMDPRSIALWREAVTELERSGLIEDRRGNGEEFFVTGAGYRLAEELRSAERGDLLTSPRLRPPRL